jgi:glycosyltransferase involved in cell wall biosynthesis
LFWDALTIHILHVFGAVTTRYGWAIDLINGLCLEQIRAGHEVTVMTTNLDWETTLEVPLRVPVRVGEVDVEYYPIDRWSGAIKIPVIRRFAISTALGRALARRMREFDIVHIQGIYLFSSIAAALLAERAGVPYVVSPHGNLDPYQHGLRSRRLKDLLMALVLRRVLENAGALIYNSDGERAKAQGFHLSSRAVVIDGGLSLDAYAIDLPERAFRDRYPATGNKRIVLYLGRITNSKGLDLLIRAFGLCIARDPDLHLALIGPDYEGLGDVLRRMVREAGLTESVTFTGMVPDDMKVAALKEAAVFAHPSYTESFGTAILEAMACGVPVVVSDGVALARELEAGANFARRCLDASPQ